MSPASSVWFLQRGINAIESSVPLLPLFLIWMRFSVSAISH